MGNVFNKNKRLQGNKKIGKAVSCPLCNKPFSSSTTYNQLNDHITDCSENNNSNTNKIVNTERSKKSNVQNIPFEEKLLIFKNNIQLLKVDWREAHCKMELSRESVLKQSIKQMEFIDPYKELKIYFEGEVSYDAGGIIREWFTVLIKELQSEQLKLFERGETNEFTYILKKNLEPTISIMEYFNFLGKLIAKAIIDNITINLCLNKLFYKLILSEEVKFNDLIFIDRTLYNSLSELKKIDNLEDLELYYELVYKDDNGRIVSEEMIKDGSTKKVTDINDYINCRIEFIINKSKMFINEIKNSIFKIIPREYLEIFTSDEFELILNGQPFIDVEEWKENTIYKGKFTVKHKIIKWFWEILFSLSQEELGRFLQFCTGTSRVPIGGFSKLESNRGEIAKFCIESTNYTQKKLNFIKAHTCFNRIDIPIYNTEKELKDSISFIINNEILGFGID